MKINRHNYETFFLLYTDNELTQPERLEVEQFVQENPDLQDEFLSFKRLVLPPEDIHFDQKEGLFKNEIQEETLEQMLLHIDGELNAQQEKILLQQINSDEQLAKELSLFRNSKLDAGEEIIFENKELLYRHSRQPRVVYLNFARWAAAAILLGIGFFATYQYLNTSVKKPAEVASTKNGNKPFKNKKITIGKTAPAEVDTLAQSMAKLNIEAEDNLPHLQTGNPMNPGTLAKENFQNHKDLHQVASKDPIQKSNHTITHLQKENNEPQGLARTVIAAPGLKDLNSGNPDEKLAMQVQPNDISYTKNENMSMVPVASFASQKSGLQELQTPENSNTVLGMDEESITKSKTGILLRKVKRLVERNTKIKTNKTLKIAGFEIATL